MYNHLHHALGNSEFFVGITQDRLMPEAEFWLPDSASIPMRMRDLCLTFTVFFRDRK